MQLGIQSRTLNAGSAATLRYGYLPAYAAQMDRVGRSRRWPPYTRSQLEAGFSRHGALFMGSPQDVAEKIVSVARQFGLTRFVAHMDVGDPGHEGMME